MTTNDSEAVEKPISSIGANSVDCPTRETLDAAYTILVSVCGASERERAQFLFHQGMPKGEYPVEWRFCGELGFGGKFWRNAGRVYVTCYRESETPQRLDVIAEANRQLAVLFGIRPR